MQWDIGKPNPRQIEFFKARARFIAYGGARRRQKLGGAQKSRRAGAVLPGAGILIVRRTFPELRENHILPMTADLAALPGTGTRTNPSRSPAAASSYSVIAAARRRAAIPGQEYDVIFYGRGHAVHGVQFTTLTACLRGANDFPKRFYLTCNPGGVGHAWVKRLFIDRRYKRRSIPKTMCLSPPMCTTTTR